MVALTSRVIPDSKPLTGWVNGNLYKHTNEVFGILPVPADVRHESGMHDFDSSFDYNQRHGFLASKQGTRKPVLPIHTNTEHKLFKMLMSEDPNFNNADGPLWKLAVKAWNRIAENDPEISYKLMEQLMVYYNDWKANLNIKQTLSLTLDDRKVVHDLIRNPRRSLQITVAPQQQMQSHEVTSGLRFLTPMDLDRNPDTEANAISTGFSQQMEEPINEPGPSFQPRSAAVAKSVASKSLSKPATKTARKGRTCRKCGVEGCPGRKEVKHCTNMCRDCGLVNCLGRNPKRPNKTCKDGWKDD
jgi:hypothetical protein